MNLDVGHGVQARGLESLKPGLDGILGFAHAHRCDRCSAKREDRPGSRERALMRRHHWLSSDKTSTSRLQFIHFIDLDLTAGFKQKPLSQPTNESVIMYRVMAFSGVTIRRSARPWPGTTPNRETI